MVRDGHEEQGPGRVHRGDQGQKFYRRFDARGSWLRTVYSRTLENWGFFGPADRFFVAFRENVRLSRPAATIPLQFSVRESRLQVTRRRSQGPLEQTREHNHAVRIYSSPAPLASSLRPCNRASKATTHSDCPALKNSWRNFRRKRGAYRPCFYGSQLWDKRVGVRRPWTRGPAPGAGS